MGVEDNESDEDALLTLVYKWALERKEVRSCLTGILFCFFFFFISTIYIPVLYRSPVLHIQRMYIQSYETPRPNKCYESRGT